MENAWKMHGENGDVTNDSYTFPKFDSSPLKSYLPNREEKLSSNHHFSRAMLNFGGIYLRFVFSWL